MTALEVDDGSTVQLGEVLAKAGEGSIYEVAGRTDLVAKLFHPTLADREEKLDKVAAMVDSPPSGAVQSDGFVVLTWPQHVLHNSARPVGYLMPRVDTTTAVEIHAVSNPFHRANPLRGAPRWTVEGTWAHLVSVAANLCLAVDVVHRVHAVIGDFQERNVLVSNASRVTLVDCDSMQFTDPDGRQFLCSVARPEFAAPELAQINLRSEPRDKASDLFALAVHIYQLLMGGNHPFMRGEWLGLGEQPSALRLAEMGCWAGGPGSKLAAHPLAPEVSFLPADLVGLFERAFTDGASDPGRRPSAAEWRRVLMGIRTTPCASGTHFVPVGTWRCPWCAIDAERGHRRQRATLLRTESSALQPISSVTDLSPVIPWPDTAVGPPISQAMPPDWGRIAGTTLPTPTAPAPYRVSWLASSIVLLGSCAIAATVIAIGAFVGREKDRTVPTSPTAHAINSAAAGDCLHRESGPTKTDGTADDIVTIVVCDSKDATDSVLLRTNDIGNCGADPWIRTDEYTPSIVLCLERK